MSENTIVNVPPGNGVRGIGSATAASATMSIEVRRKGSAATDAARPFSGTSSRRQSPKVTTWPGATRVGPTRSAPSSFVPLVLPRSATTRRPAVALSRRC